MPASGMRVDTCHKVERKMLDEIRVEIEPGYGAIASWREPEKAYEEWAKELLDFIRDHRSRDVNDIRVVVPTFDACSACGQPWEPAHFPADASGPGFTGCAWCGIPVGKDGDS